MGDPFYARCPKCGRFVSGVTARIRGFGGEERIDSVFGVCAIHRRVDVSEQPWCWEDFFPEDAV